MIVVSDTSPLLSLIYIDQLHLLPLLFKEVVIPEQVDKELQGSKLSAEQKQNLRLLTWLSVITPANTTAVKNLITTNLHLPEAQAIILAKELHADFILIDEQQGRAIAKTQGLTIVGVLGILLQAKQQNYITSIKELMDILIQKTGFWISPTLYEQLLKLANER